MPNEANFLNTLREKLIDAAEEIKGIDVWTAGPLDEPKVTGFVLDYAGECYVVEIFAKKEADRGPAE